MISIILPTLNEEAELPKTFESIHANIGPFEVIVVDAGSTDQTASIAMAQGARVIAATKRQRAAQMNQGAAVAKGNVFLFLHADTWLPRDALAQIEAVCKGAVTGGGFQRRFRSDSLFLKATCRLADLRCRAFGLFLGDQAIFVRREVFESMRGFREMDTFEDVDFCRRLRRRRNFTTIESIVTSSARRFRNGPIRRTVDDLILTARYVVQNAAAAGD